MHHAVRSCAAAVLAGLALISLARPAAAQSLDNKGDDFIMAFLPGLGGVTTELHLTADVATTVNIEYPVNSPAFTTSVPVGPGAVTIVTVPSTSASGWTFNAVRNNAVHAFAADEFVCYMINRELFTSDAGLALPVDTMNTEFIVTDYNPRFVGAEFVVVAAFDNTDVTITPTNALVGRAAGVPFTVTLNRGQGYAARSLAISGAAGTLTGTTVSATRPVGLTNGDGCTQIPTGTVACDHIFEVAQPVQTWGDRILVANLPLRPNGSIYRITASVNGTTVRRNGVPIAVLNAGQFFETAQLTGSHEFTGDNAIFVTQYMTGLGAGNTTGDPAMANMIPVDQYLSAYTFSTVGGGQFAQNFVTIIAANGDVGSLLLDGVPVPAASFTAIGLTGFSSAVVPLTSGTHSTASTNPHGITVEGYNSFDSYIYPGGARFRFINPVGDANPPVCTCTETATGFACTATDDRPSEDTNGNGVLDPGEDLNNDGLIDEDTGIFFVQLAPGAVNMTLTVDPFVPGDPSVDYTLTPTDDTLDASGTVVVTDGAGNTCETDHVIVANEAPTIDCDDEVTAECTSTDGAAVTLDAVVGDEDGDDLTVTWTIAGTTVQTVSAQDGDTVSLTRTFALGSHTVTVCVDDGTADPVCCDITVVVEDTTAPVVTVAAPATMWPPNHKYVEFDLADCVTSIVDACDGALDVDGVAVIVSISSDEPEDAQGNGDGRTEDDIVITGDTTFELRAERQGNGNGRVYTVVFEVTDDAGNVATARCLIGVPHSQNGDAPVDDGAAAGYTVTN